MSGRPQAICSTLPALLAAVVACAPVAVCQDPAFDAAEARTALKAALAQNTDLQERLAAEKAANNAMAVKVGILSSEAASTREELAELRRRAEATGSVGDTRVLEQRVLDALNDLRLTREARDSGEERLHRLVEAVQAYLAADPETATSLRAPLEAALASAAAPVPSTDPVPSPARIEASRVVSVKSDQRLLVVNAGRLAGLKPGTPIRIYRNDRPLASAVVVEVRSALSGTLVTQLEGEEFPQVGDTLRLLSDAH